MKIRSFTISLLVLTIFSMNLTSCGALPVPPTLTPLPTQTSTPIATPTKAETPTSIPTETSAPAESDLRPAYIETVVGELLGVQITTSLITDKSLDPIITKVTINDHFNNSDGKNSKDAITEFTARTFYKVWLKKGGIDGTGPKTDTSFEEYMAMWARAQSSEGTEADWRAVQITVLANHIVTEGYVPEKTVIWPMFTGNVDHEGVNAINVFEIALVKATKMKNIQITNSELGVGRGTNLDKNNLIIYNGLNTSSPNIKFDHFIIASISVIAQSMSSNSNPTSLDYSLIRILTLNYNKLNNRDSAIIIE